MEELFTNIALEDRISSPERKLGDALWGRERCPIFTLNELDADEDEQEENSYQDFGKLMLLDKRIRECLETVAEQKELFSSIRSSDDPHAFSLAPTKFAEYIDDTSEWLSDIIQSLRSGLDLGSDIANREFQEDMIQRATLGVDELQSWRREVFVPKPTPIGIVVNTGA
jgi:hypothetical protein